ncbi:hypothetical protein [Bradyrhizobium diversitatis]|uniref:Uncharacterized protein n=1 Tax=Bradyrhizobium diversitatis TaxID=2755406 RepID=A0ABS0PEM4_9BRAD|nr:hypothetical protein [Bradyrhizobium diversitatis]MBH5391767.1 hypothetical protein [Bradyrhizobium diversitatis]
MRTMVGVNGCTGVIAANNNDFGRGADWLSKRGAMALAKHLQAYWHRHGYPAARFWPEPIDERFSKIGTYEIYTIACNLINGLPPSYR